MKPTNWKRLALFTWMLGVSLGARILLPHSWSGDLFFVVVAWTSAYPLVLTTSLTPRNYWLMMAVTVALLAALRPVEIPSNAQAAVVIGTFAVAAVVAIWQRRGKQRQ